MSLSDFTGLKNSILDFMGRSGDLTIPVEDMIELAEAELNRVLTTRNQVSFIDLTTIADQQEYSLPTAYQSLLEVKLTSANPVIVLEPMGPGEFDESFPFADSSRPSNYTVVGSNILFGPTPDGVYTVRLRFYAKLPPISETTPTNWLLNDHPDCYLWTALRHAETFLGADISSERIALFETRSQASIKSITMNDIRAKTGGAPVRMRTYLRPRDSVFPR